MLFVLSGTLVVIKLAANCYKNLFPFALFSCNKLLCCLLRLDKKWCNGERENWGKFYLWHISLDAFQCLLPRRTVRFVAQFCVVGERMFQGEENINRWELSKAFLTISIVHLKSFQKKSFCNTFLNSLTFSSIKIAKIEIVLLAKLLKCCALNNFVSSIDYREIYFCITSRDENHKFDTFHSHYEGQNQPDRKSVV